MQGYGMGSRINEWLALAQVLFVLMSGMMVCNGWNTPDGRCPTEYDPHKDTTCNTDEWRIYNYRCNVFFLSVNSLVAWTLLVYGVLPQVEKFSIANLKNGGGSLANVESLTYEISMGSNTYTFIIIFAASTTFVLADWLRRYMQLE